jgi:hypothetical protein
MMNFNVYFCLSLVFLSGCAHFDHRNDQAFLVAKQGNLVSTMLATPEFDLMLFHRGLISEQKQLVIYIEGDGQAWRRKHILSNDPTPTDPLALRFAANDSSPAVLYIARPCQYQKEGSSPECATKYWSSHRYSEEVVTSVNFAIDWGVRQTGATTIFLVGYSGGGTVAVLVAARRHDVAGLATIAANLDHRFWTEIHNVSPLVDSLNAADFTNSVENIPQVHFAGAKDKIVPPIIAESYRAKFTDVTMVEIRTVNDFDHLCCWEDVWPDVLCRSNTFSIPGCKKM